MKPLSVLFVVNDLGFFFSHRLPIAKALKNSGYEVHIASPDHPYSAQLVDLDIKFHTYFLTRRGINPLQELRSLLELYQLYKKLRPTHVHHVTIKPIIYGGIAARLAQIPNAISAVSGLGYLYTEQGFKSSLMRKLVNFIYRISLKHPGEIVIFQNEDDRNAFLTNHLIDIQKTVMIRGSGVNTEEYKPTPEPDGIPVVVLAARLLKHKGIVEYVEAARMLRQENIPAHFFLMGDTDEGNPSCIQKAQVEEWMQSGIVEWRGYSKDIAAVFSKCHIVVLPSYREGVPKVLLEACASARPIVTTDVPGCRDVVRHGVNGLLVKAKSASELAEAIKILLKDPTMRKKLGEAGRAIAVNEYSEDLVVSQTLKVYQEILV